MNPKDVIIKGPKTFQIFVASESFAMGSPYVMQNAECTASPTGIAPPEMFLDYCHMTWRGYQAMAHALVEALIAGQAIIPEAGEPLPAPSVDEMIEKFGWQRLRELNDTTPLTPQFNYCEH